MVHLTLIAVCFLAAIFLQVEAFSGFLKTKSLIFREPPVDLLTTRSSDVSEHWITQKLDNFDPTDTRTFRMVMIDDSLNWKAYRRALSSTEIFAKWTVFQKRRTHLSRGWRRMDHQ